MDTQGTQNTKSGAWKRNQGLQSKGGQSEEQRDQIHGRQREARETDSATTEVQRVSLPLTGRLKDLKRNRPLPYLLSKTK